MTLDKPEAGLPVIAPLLSFLWPGLGQAYRGRRRAALIQGVPALVVVTALIGLLLAVGAAVAIAYLLNPAVAVSLIAVVVGLGLLRVFSILDAARPVSGTVTASRSRRNTKRGLVVLMIAITVVTHGWLGYTLWAFGQAGAAIYEPSGPGPSPVAVSTSPPPSTIAPAGSITPQPAPTPDEEPIPAGDDGRITVLLVGVDNTGGPQFGLADTLIVASLDEDSRTLSMVSLPRDTARLPLYSGGTYSARINTLLRAARRDPVRFPDGPMATLMNEMSYLVGVQIDYYAQISIAGLTELVDSVGGIDVVVDRAIHDQNYQFSPTEIGFHLEPGAQHLDGKYATAFARSRHGRGNTDYARARRQQTLLLALRNRLNDPLVAANLPGIVDAFSQVLRTDMPLDRLPDLVQIAQRSGGAETRHVVLSPTRYAQKALNSRGERTFANELRMDMVEALSIELFGDDSLYSAGP